MAKFKEYLLEEGEQWDAIVHGFKTGWTAYKDKRTEQKQKTIKEKVNEKLLTAEGEQLKDLVKQIVSNDFRVTRNGELKDKPDKMHAWLNEGNRWHTRHNQCFSTG
jgi:hypothetical protein